MLDVAFVFQERLWLVILEKEGSTCIKLWQTEVASLCLEIVVALFGGLEIFTNFAVKYSTKARRMLIILRLTILTCLRGARRTDLQFSRRPPGCCCG